MATVSIKRLNVAMEDMLFFFLLLLLSASDEDAVSGC